MAMGIWSTEELAFVITCNIYNIELLIETDSFAFDRSQSLTFLMHVTWTKKYTF